MSICRIQNIIPACGYRAAGIDQIMLLDYEDFEGFSFNSDDLYSNCMIIRVMRSGELVTIDCSETASYESVLQSGLYVHTLETFINELSANFSSILHLATKRRFVVFTRTKTGKYFAFGYEAGATLSYSNQTSESIGSLITLSANSTYPLFEVSPSALTSNTQTVEFVPDFETGAYCTMT